MTQYQTLSQHYKHNSATYRAACDWLQRNAQHERLKKGRGYAYHVTDIAAFKAQYNPQELTLTLDAIVSVINIPMKAQDVINQLTLKGLFPDQSAVYRHLNNAVRKGLLTRTGRGNRGDVYVYSPPQVKKSRRRYQHSAGEQSL